MWLLWLLRTSFATGGVRSSLESPSDREFTTTKEESPPAAFASASALASGASSLERVCSSCGSPSFAGTVDIGYALSLYSSDFE